MSYPTWYLISRRRILIFAKKKTWILIVSIASIIFVIFKISQPQEDDGKMKPLLNIQITVVPTSSLPTCSGVEPPLIGISKVPTSTHLSIAQIDKLYEKDLSLSKGEAYIPSNCNPPADRVAILIPYRNREKHLKVFLVHMLPFLKRQHVGFRIFVVEQLDSQGKAQPFNRAMLLNIGFVEATRMDVFDCVILHDVDSLPENDLNLYSCADAPRHLSSAAAPFNYSLLYEDNVGGVLTVGTSQFQATNGLSNRFWGWGGEDDDFGRRLVARGFSITRAPLEVGRYTMLDHQPEAPSEERNAVLRDGPLRYSTDGINSLNYTLVEVVRHATFTLLRVQLEREEVEEANSTTHVPQQ